MPADRQPIAEDPLPGPPALIRRVERAVADLRRGTPVVMVDHDREEAALVLAVETAGGSDTTVSPEVLDQLASLSGSAPALVVTGRRAHVLGLGRAGQGPRSILLSQSRAPALIALLADPFMGADAVREADLTALLEPEDGIAAAALTTAKRARLWPTVLVSRLDFGAIHNAERYGLEDGLVVVSTEDLARAPAAEAARLKRVAEARVPLADVERARLVTFRPPDGGTEHVAILVGDPEAKAAAGEPVLARLHSECFTGDLLGSLRCDCGDQLRGALKAMAEAGDGVLLYLAQEGRDIGLVNKLRAYQLQDGGMDTVDANLHLGFEADERDFRPAAAMLRTLGITSVRLMTNNPDKLSVLADLGVEIVERVPLVFEPNPHNAGYLATKATKSGHQF